MAGPATIEDYQISNWADAVDTSEVTASISWQSGDLIVVFGATEDSGVTFATPTATGLTFASVASVGGASNAFVQCWTATAGGTSSGAVTATLTGITNVKMRGLAAFVCRNHNGAGTPATLTGSANKVISLAVADTASVVLACFMDFNAAAVGTAATPTGTLRLAQNVAGRATGHVLSWTDQAAGTRNYGYTGGGTADNNGIVIEVKGTAAASDALVAQICI